MLKIRHEAEEDIRGSYFWYESKSKNLGNRFVSELDTIFEKIQNNPQKYQIVFENIRRALCMRFPYSIYFTENSNEIVIIAILHQKRNPDILDDRIQVKNLFI
jgi:plasmid stabilization system protein ParE